MEEKRKKYWLNEYGSRYWYKKSNMSITAHRSYHWVDRVSFLEEATVNWLEDKQIWSTSDRHHNQGPDITYTEFKKQLENWTPIENFDEYASHLNDYKKYNI